jgi:hypothetical protein
MSEVGQQCDSDVARDLRFAPTENGDTAYDAELPFSGDQEILQLECRFK